MPHRLITADPAALAAPRRRLVYATGYLLMAAAGALAAIWPSPNVSSAAAAASYLVLVWDAFLVVGGLCSAIGAITQRWIGEYVGLPLLASVFAVYGVAALVGGRPFALAGGAAFLGITALFAGRWLDVAAVRRLASAAGRLTRPPDGPR